MNETIPLQSRMLRIFVVENHRDTLTYLSMYLESLGHTVASARTVKEARAGWHEGEYDVLISDIGLPDGDGWELLRQMQADSAEPIFAIAMSGFGLNADHLRSRNAGYRHHLLKPFELGGLDAMLEEAGRELPAEL